MWGLLFSFELAHLSHLCSCLTPMSPQHSHDLWTLVPGCRPEPELRSPASQPASPFRPLLQQCWDFSPAGDLGQGGCAFLALSHPGPALPQVVSPLTEAVLGETLLTVTEEKVSITQLQAQVVASLALSLRPSPGSSHTILATTATQQTLSFLKQVTGCLAHQPGI